MIEIPVQFDLATFPFLFDRMFPTRYDIAEEVHVDVYEMLPGYFVEVEPPWAYAARMREWRP